MRVDYQAFYRDNLHPLLDQSWIRADTRRVLNRLAMLSPRHRVHIKTYARIYDAPAEKIVKTMARDLIITPFMVGRRVAVHNGRSYPVLLLNSRQVGYRLGEFAYPKKALHNHTSKTRAKLKDGKK